MRERHIPKPLPEGNHGHPEGAKGEPTPVQLLHEHAMRVFENDPKVRVLRRGSKSFPLATGTELIANAFTQNSTGIGEITYNITLHEQLADGSLEPRGDVYMDTDGVLKRNNAEIEYLEVRRELDEYERKQGLRQINPLTGEESPSAERMQLELEQIREIDEQLDMQEELGLNALSDREAVEFIRFFQIQLPGDVEEITLPDNPENGPQQAQTVEAFKKVAEAIANQNILRMSEWIDIDDIKITLKSTTLLAEDGTETPHEVILEELDTTEVMRSGTMHKVDWVAQSDIFKTGTIEQVFFGQSRQVNTPEVIDVNKAAKDAYEAHMESLESDATPEQLRNLILYIDSKADEFEIIRESTAKDNPEEHGPETSALAAPRGQVDVVVLPDKKTIFASDEPQVGGEEGKSIAEQEQDGPDKPNGNDKGKGKSK